MIAFFFDESIVPRDKEKLLLIYLSKAKLLVRARVRGCMKTRPRAEGSYDARLGFPFLINSLVPVGCLSCAQTGAHM